MPNVGIAIFLKAPRLGKVKTRLATVIGEERALELYRLMGASAVQAARASGLPVVVWYEPAECRALMVDWLGADLDFRTQTAGDLGARMAAAVASDRATMLIGGDCPALATHHLTAAADALARGSAVLGPTEDGGYYLLGVDSHPPDLFSQMPWSTESVAAETRRRLEIAGISWLELETLRDVDTAADAEAAGLLPLRVAG